MSEENNTELKKLSTKYTFFLILFIFFILFIIFVIYYVFFRKEKETLDYFGNNVYVIHLLRSTDRVPSLIRHQNDIRQVINVFEGVDGKMLKDELIEKEYPIKHRYKYNFIGEVGCYLSHYLLLSMIRDNEIKMRSSKYSLILEDDMHIPNQYRNEFFMDLLKDHLLFLENQSVDFDLLYLGTVTNYQGTDCIGKDGVLKEFGKVGFSNEPCWGTQAYIVKNESLIKLCNELYYMNESYDGRLSTLASQGKLKAYVLRNPLVLQTSQKTGSLIRG